MNHIKGRHMKIIGIEEHFLTTDIQNAWDAIGLDALDPSVRFHSDAIHRRLFDLSGERLDLMDETGLDMQVLSLTTPGLHDLGPESVDLARRTNDFLAEVVARHPTRFQAMATLPITSPREAALELERCVATLGFKGAILSGRVGNRNLDDPALTPVFAAAEAVCAPILLHPRIPAAPVRDAYYSGFSPEIDVAFATYGIGWHYDAGVQFLRLVLGGLFDRMPGLQVILGHWGELVLFYAERFAALDRVSGLEHPIATYQRRNLYVTASGMFLPHYLERAAAIVGADRLLFSTDYPFQYRPGQDARRFVERCGLSTADQIALAHGNWMRLTEGMAGLPGSRTNARQCSP